MVYCTLQFKRERLLLWILEKAYLFTKKKRDKFEAMFIDALSAKISCQSYYSSDGPSSENQDMTIYEMLAMHNTNFYHRFKKFFEGFCNIPAASQCAGAVNSTHNYYEKMKVTLTLPGIRRATQKIEKVVENDKVNQFIEDQDKLYVTEFAPTIWQEYEYLFTNKYPKLDPVH